MRCFLLVGLALPLLATPAVSQITTTPPASQPNSGMPVPARPTQPMPNTTARPDPMVPGATTSTLPPAMTTTTPSVVSGGKPGANSFTEDQARKRLMENGYTAVTDLAKDKDGVWRGRATKNSKSVAVSVDYKGDISGG